MLKNIGYNGSLTMEFMHRIADPYSSKEINTEAALMDSYTKQAIDYIKMIERSVDTH